MKNIYEAMSTSELVGKLPYTDDVLKISNLSESLIIHIYFQECDEQGNYFVAEIMDSTDGIRKFYHNRYDNGFEAVLAIFQEHEKTLIPSGSFMCSVFCTHEQRIAG